MTKLSTQQAIRQALKKKKGKKSNKSKGIDTHGGNKPNDIKRLGTKKEKGKGKPVINNDVTACNNTEYYNIDEDSLMISSGKVDLKKPLSVNEQRFLGLHLIGKHSRREAMILAGYEGYSPKTLDVLARKTILRYECQTGDHRKIMRALGWGEVRVLQSLIEAATVFNSETVRLNARESLAKCLGIQKETIEQAEGIQIIINQGCQPADEPAALDLPKAPPPSSGALTITK